MKHLKVLYSISIVSLLIVLPACNNTEKSETNSRQKPNIIYIMADDLGWGDLSCYGQKKFQTPNIDKLASEGMRFTQHYAGSTVCAPSRCVLMTGLHTGHSIVRGNREHKPEGQYPIPDETVTIAELLKDAGYVTGATGKWGLGFPGSEGDPVNQGFDYFFGYNCQREAHFYYPEHLWENEQKIMIPENQNGEKEVYSHNLITKKAIKFIRKNKEKPFFLYVPYTIPHAELTAPKKEMEKFIGKFEEKPYPGRHYGAQKYPRAAYATMVSIMDGDVGKIMDLLSELNLDSRTLVFFTSDNGPHKEGGNNPGFFDSNGPYRGIKRDLYEGGIRVPLIARWKGKIKAGTETDHASAFWDFLPTICEITGIPLPENIDGISYLPALKGEKQEQHRYLYWEFHEHGGKQAVIKGEWKAVRLNVQNKPANQPELYNLSSDPGEQNNVAKDNPGIVKELELIMNEAHKEDTLWTFIPGKLIR